MNMKKGKAQPVRKVSGAGLLTKRNAIILAVVLLAGGYWLSNENGISDNTAQLSSAAPASQAGRYPFKVKSPGPGELAPPVRLTSTLGTVFDLEAWRGKTVMLYFQEGLMCEACWVQLREIEANFSRFRDAGIDTMATITTDPPDLLARKAQSEKLQSPVLADPSLSVSQTYRANGDGMMNANYNAHTFVIVGPDGKIRWRADYGGGPDYNMYVPLPYLLADIDRGLKTAPGQTAQ